MKLATLLLAGAICALPMAASAQWQWVDKDGRKVFSDQSPPPDIPEKNILRRPMGAAMRAPAVAPAPGTPSPGAQGTQSATSPTAGAPKISSMDKDLQEKVKQEKVAEQSKQKDIEEKQAKVMADICRRAKASQETLNSGVRLAQLNAKGEREIMDDAARAAESKRVQAAIAENCKG